MYANNTHIATNIPNIASDIIHLLLPVGFETVDLFQGFVKVTIECDPSVIDIADCRDFIACDIVNVI